MFVSLVVAASLVPQMVEPVAAPTEMRWVAPPGCPSADMVRGWLRELTEYDGSGMTARVRPGRTAPWVVDISVESETSRGSTRSISGESCEAVARAAVVAVALSRADPASQVDDAWDAAEGEPDAVVPPPDEPIDAAAPRDAAAPSKLEDSRAQAPFRPPRLRLRLLAAGVLGYGALPKTAGGVYAGVGLQGRLWWVDVGAQHWFRSFAPASLPDAGISIALTTANVGVGPRFGWGPVELNLGVVGQGGRARAVSTGATQPKTTYPVWWALGAQAGLRWFPVPWVSLGGRVTAAAPLVRHRYVLGGEMLHRPTVVGFESALVLTFVLGQEKSKAGP